VAPVSGVPGSPVTDGDLGATGEPLLLLADRALALARLFDVVDDLCAGGARLGVIAGYPGEAMEHPVVMKSAACPGAPVDDATTIVLEKAGFRVPGADKAAREMFELSGAITETGAADAPILFVADDDDQVAGLVIALDAAARLGHAEILTSTSATLTEDE